MIFPFCHLPSHNRPSVNILEIVQSKKKHYFLYLLAFCYSARLFSKYKSTTKPDLILFGLLILKSSSFPSSYYGGDNRFFFLKKCWCLLFGVRTGYCGCGKRGCPSRVIHPVEQRSSMATTTS